MWIVLLIVIVCLVILLISIPQQATAPHTRLCATPSSHLWFTYRDALPQTPTPPDQWYDQDWTGGWGPKPAQYPVPTAPYPSITDIARHYLELRYQHHHIPAWDPSATLTGKPNESPGLDCSNFTSWVYNYGRGIRFTSDIHQQAAMYEHPHTNANGQPVYMTRIDRPTPTTLPTLQSGDLLYFWRSLPTGGQEISHVAMFTQYLGTVPYIIDSHGVGVTEHPLTGAKDGWYEHHFDHAIRLTIP